MGLWDKIKTFLQVEANRRKVIVAGVAVLAVVGLVLFGPNLQNLFNRPPSQASITEDIAKTWQNLIPGTVQRAHAKTIAVDQGGKRWLYVIGGLKTYDSGGVTHSQLLSTVQRVEINPDDGSPKENAAWESVSSLNTGHAEFGVLTTTVNSKPYLYVVGGDIHVPKITTAGPLDKVPLLYSTIERLDLSNNNAAWETVALLTGVNFYPEVAMFDGRLHVVGGVYGNPFGDSIGNCGPSAYGTGTNTSGGYTAADPIDLNADFARWPVIGGLPVIGPNNPGLDLSVAQTGAIVIQNSLIVTQTGTGTPPPPETTTRTQTLLFPSFKIGTAHAAATAPMTVTTPPAGVVLNPGITYSIVVDNVPVPLNLPPKSYIGLYYRDMDNRSNSDWQFIPGSTKLWDGWIVPYKYIYNWVVPNIKTNHVQIRASFLYTDQNGQTNYEPGTDNPAYSGIFSIGDTFANMLSESLLSGDFVTTVSEHYAINLANPADNRASELGSDFNGSFSSIWGPGAIMHIGHLRFTEVATGTDVLEDGRTFYTYKIVPVPQGRYGHKLFIDNNKLVVVGGASWMPEQQYQFSNYLHYPNNSLHYGVKLTGRYFWVIDSAHFPLMQVKNEHVLIFPSLWTDPRSDGYIGHIAYTLGNSSAAWQVAPEYDLKSAGVSKGRAFFGFALSAQKPLAVAGLENTTSGDITVTLSYDFAQPEGSYASYFIGVAPTGRTESLSGSSWASEPDYPNGEAVYNLTAVGLDTRTIAFGGQTQFACSTNPTDPWLQTWDPHVPNPALPRSNTTALFQQSTNPSTGSAWYPMESIGTNGDGTADLIFSADALVTTTLDSGPSGQGIGSTVSNWYIYRYGGFAQVTQTTPLTISNAFQGLGVFTSAQHGVPYPPNSTFTIEPSTVTADGHTAAIATVTLKDYFGDVVAGKHTVVYGEPPNNHLPPQDTDDVKVTPFSTSQGGHGDSPDSGFDAHYLKTDDQGMASFKLTSTKVAIQQMRAVWADTPGTSQGTIGPVPVEFTDENVPDQLLSTVEVDRDQVVANNTDYATITVTLRGKKNGIPNSPLPGFWVQVFSDRNLKDNVVDTFTTLTNPTDPKGQATFQIKSGTKGLATISAAYYALADPDHLDPIYLSQTRAVRFVGADEFAITLTADPLSLPLAGIPNSSLLTASVVGPGNQPINNAKVTFLRDGNDGGSISPIQVATSPLGKAQSHYYRVSGLTAPTAVTVTAQVTLTGPGLLSSNPVVITIGLDNDYSLIFVTDKTQLPAGGTERAKLTATLTHKGAPQFNWPMTFSLMGGQMGDSLTVLSGTTNAQGILETEFVPGIYPGPVIITAQPAGLRVAQLSITKTLDTTIDPKLSTISAVPSFVPADNSSTSTITVTLRNSKYSPLPGKSVTVTSSQGSKDTFDSTTQITNNDGKAFFRVRSGDVHVSEISATVAGITLGPVKVHFEPVGNLISATLDVTVPLEAKAYDRQIMVYLREQVANMNPAISEVYPTDANDNLIGLPIIYLHPNQPYVLWVKGRYHLARVLPFTAPATSGQTVTLNFTALLIGDLASSTSSEVFPGFNDNAVNTIDFPPLLLSWFKDSYLADFDGNGVVNSLDIVYLFHNFGTGAPLP